MVLNFINNKGKKVMELKDNGDLNILNEELKRSFSEKSLEETEEKENKND